MNAENRALQHAADCGVFFESCGLVVETENGQIYHPCQNIAENPAINFEIDPDDWIDASELGEVVAVVHSHPEGTPYLTESDRTSQRRTGLPWWVVADGKVHKFRNVPPLIGRVFEYGTVDCYTLMRDAYALAGIDLPDFPRPPDLSHWNAEEPYLERMENHGFYQVDVPHPGDVILMQIQSDSTNHAAIYLGDGMMMHHLTERLSCRELYGGYWQRHTRSIWRHRQWQESAFMAIYNDLAAFSI